MGGGGKADKDGESGNLASGLAGSDAFPIFPRDASLSKNNAEKANPDIASMGIRNRQDDVASSHELMFASADRTGEPEPFKPGDEVTPLRWRPRRH